MFGIHHAGIVVSDLDRAIDFYTGVVGLTLLSEPTGPSAGPHLDRILELDGACIRGVLLQAGVSAIELHEFQAPTWSGEQPVPAHALGAQHVAFWTEDVVAEKRLIEGRGGVFLADVNVIDTGVFAGLRTAFLRDPDGIRVEFVEIAYWPDDLRRAGIADYLSHRAEPVT